MIAASISKFHSKFFTHKSEGEINTYWCREIEVLNDACLLSSRGFSDCAYALQDSLKDINKRWTALSGHRILEASELFLFGMRIVRDWEDEMLVREAGVSAERTALAVVNQVFHFARHASEHGDDLLKWTEAYHESRTHKVRSLSQRFMWGDHKLKTSKGKTLLSFAEAVLVLNAIHQHYHPNMANPWSTIKANSIDTQTGLLKTEDAAITYNEAVAFSRDFKRKSMESIQNNYANIMDWLVKGANPETSPLKLLN